MSDCKKCDDTGWYSITAAEFERKHDVTTDLAPDQLMSFPCDQCELGALRPPALPGSLSADTGPEGDV